MAHPIISKLIWGSGIAVAAALGTSLVHAQADTEEKPVRMKHLIVERLDVVEPDGTLRVALYSKARDPGAILRGKSYPHPARTQSGMLFYNDEGSEVGGLIFAGRTGPDGKRESGGALSFDGYEQDQIVQLIGYREGGDGLSGLSVSDRPDKSMDYSMMSKYAAATSQKEAEAIAQSANFGGQSRAFFGRDGEENSTVVLRDGEGRKRLIMKVQKDGEASINFLNEKGQIVRTVKP